MEIKILKQSENVRFCVLSIEQAEHFEPTEEFEALSQLYARGDCAIAALSVPDSDNALSPWPAPAVFGNNDFGSGAGTTLNEIVANILPKLDGELGDPVYIIEGYSFAGLFALWAAYNSDRFSGVCAVSPSVWFDGWMDYIQQHSIKTKCAYLSVGASEKKTRNQRMSTVESCLKLQHSACANDIGEKRCRFELNKGNHFTDVALRRAKAMAWCLKTLCKPAKKD